MRSHVVVLFGLAFASLPSLAHADDTSACIESAENAQKLRHDKKLTEARPQLLTCSRDVCPQQVRTDCVKWLTDLDNSMSTIVVRARDSQGHDLIDVKVYVDDQLFLPKLQGTSVPIDPGQHKFRYELPNGKTIEDNVLIAEGEKDRVLRVNVPAQAAAGGGTGGGEQTGGAGGGGAETPTAKGGAGPVPWIIGGVGVVALGVFIGLQVDAQSTYSSLKNGCGATQSCPKDQVDSLGTEFGVSGVFLAIGAAAVVASATWLIVSAVTGHPAKHETMGSLGVTPLPGGGFVGLSGSF
jgi:hypothetical protein